MRDGEALSWTGFTSCYFGDLLLFEYVDVIHGTLTRVVSLHALEPKALRMVKFFLPRLEVVFFETYNLRWCFQNWQQGAYKSTR